jgi:predicted SprT family Zn-dependent metalloprotease
LLKENENQDNDFGDADWEADSPPVIRINPLLREQGWYTAIRQTLLHEAAHVEAMRLGYKGEHGEKWEKIMRRLAKKGAFSLRNGISSLPLW